jgi:hypothetical protein
MTATAQVKLDIPGKPNIDWMGINGRGCLVAHAAGLWYVKDTGRGWRAACYKDLLMVIAHRWFRRKIKPPVTYNSTVSPKILRKGP